MNIIQKKNINIIMEDNEVLKILNKEIKLY